MSGPYYNDQGGAGGADPSEGGTKYKNASTGVWETVSIGTEYFSRDQRGGVHGKVLVRFFNVASMVIGSGQALATIPGTDLLVLSHRYSAFIGSGGFSWVTYYGNTVSYFYIRSNLQDIEYFIQDVAFASQRLICDVDYVRNPEPSLPAWP